MDPLTIVGTLLGTLLTGGLFKAKLYCIWTRKPGSVWVTRNASGNSARRCKKARKVLVDGGTAPGDIMILAKGITPIK
jgi:hypothetical protein